jgi:hypothetical protein
VDPTLDFDYSHIMAELSARHDRGIFSHNKATQWVWVAGVLPATNQLNQRVQQLQAFVQELHAAEYGQDTLQNA